MNFPGLSKNPSGCRIFINKPQSRLKRKRARAVEWAALEMRYTRNGIGGSNPPASALCGTNLTSSALCGNLRDDFFGAIPFPQKNSLPRRPVRRSFSGGGVQISFQDSRHVIVSGHFCQK